MRPLSWSTRRSVPPLRPELGPRPLGHLRHCCSGALHQLTAQHLPTPYRFFYYGVDAGTGASPKARRTAFDAAEVALFRAVHAASVVADGVLMRSCSATISPCTAEAI